MDKTLNIYLFILHDYVWLGTNSMMSPFGVHVISKAWFDDRLKNTKVVVQQAD